MLRRLNRTMVTIAALSALVMVSQAGAADKLVVMGTDGTTKRFTVDESGATFIKGPLGVNVTGALQADMVVTRDITAGGTVMFLDGVGETGNGPNIAIRTGRGVIGAMNASQQGDIVGQANFRGAFGTAGSATFAPIRRAGFVSYATENYTSTAQGTNVSFVTTANGTTSPTEKLIVNGDGLIYIGQAMKDGAGAFIPAPTVSSPNTKLAIVGDGLRITMTRTPASATATCNQGEISYDANYVYVCTGTNSWKRSALAAW